MSDTRPDLPPPSAPNFAQRVRETLMTYLGRQGSALDRGLTVRDLIDAGIAKIKAGYSGWSGAGSVVPLEPVVDVYEPDLTPPPTPTGVIVSPGVTHIIIKHDPPMYSQGHGHARTRLYGKARGSGDPLPVFGDAAEVAQFTGTVYAFATNPATTWHFWLKWESVDGVLSQPAGGTNGFEATTAEDVSTLLAALTGQITQSQLFSSLSSRIDLIDAPSTVAGSVNARIKVVQDQVNTLLDAPEYSASASYSIGDVVKYDGKLYRAIAATTGNLPTNTTYWELVGDYESLAAVVSAHTATLNDHESRIDVVEGDLTAEVTARQALAAQIRGSYTGTDPAQLTSGLLYNERTVRVSAENAIASDVSTLSARVSGFGPNLLQNSSFELNLVDPSALADGWESYTFGTVSGAAWAVSTDYRWHGSSSQKVSFSSSGGTPSHCVGVYQTVDINQSLVGSKVTASVYVSGTSGATGVVAVDFRNSSGTVISGSLVSSDVALSGSGSWTRAVVSQTSVPAGAVKARVYAWLYRSGGSAAEMYIDAFQLQAGDATGYLGPDISASLQTEAVTRASAVSGIEAKYTVKVDLNGYIAGYGLIGTANDATPTSSFAVRADQFYIAPPTNYSQPTAPASPSINQIWFNTTTKETKIWNGSAWVNFTNNLPFVVRTTGVTENGVSIPPGTYIDAAYIVNLTALNARIGQLVADDIAAADISTAQLTGGAIRVGAYIQSQGFSSGVSGWRINADGSAEFNNIALRNNVTARGITIYDSNNRVILSSGAGLGLTPGGANLVGNSSFEQWTSGQRPVGYDFYGNGCTGVLSQVSGIRPGSYAVSSRCTGITTPGGFGFTTATNPAEGGRVYGVAWKQNTWYTISLWARRHAGTSNLGGLGLAWNSAPNDVVWKANPTLTSTWQRYEVAFRWTTNTPEDGGILYLNVQNGSNLQVNDEIHYDDFMVQEGDVATSWALSPFYDTVSTANPVTTTNVSTYIEAAAIGSLDILTTGKLRSGKSSYGSGTGWLLEYNNGTPRLDVGTPTRYVRWNGTNLELSGLEVKNEDGVMLFSATGSAVPPWVQYVINSGTAGVPLVGAPNPETNTVPIRNITVGPRADERIGISINVDDNVEVTYKSEFISLRAATALQSSTWTDLEGIAWPVEAYTTYVFTAQMKRHGTPNSSQLGFRLVLPTGSTDGRLRAYNMTGATLNTTVVALSVSTGPVIQLASGWGTASWDHIEIIGYVTTGPNPGTVFAQINRSSGSDNVAIAANSVFGLQRASLAPSTGTLDATFAGDLNDLYTLTRIGTNIPYTSSIFLTIKGDGTWEVSGSSGSLEADTWLSSGSAENFEVRFVSTSVTTSWSGHSIDDPSISLTNDAPSWTDIGSSKRVGVQMTVLRRGTTFTITGYWSIELRNKITGSVTTIQSAASPLGLRISASVPTV